MLSKVLIATISFQGLCIVINLVDELIALNKRTALFVKLFGPA